MRRFGWFLNTANYRNFSFIAITDDGPHLRTVPCGKPGDCNHVDGTYCDADVGLCLCKPDYPVTDSSHCYKGMSASNLRYVFWLLHCYAQSPSTMTFANWTFSAKNMTRIPNAIGISICANANRNMWFNLSTMANLGVSVSRLPTPYVMHSLECILNVLLWCWSKAYI